MSQNHQVQCLNAWIKYSWLQHDSGCIIIITLPPRSLSDLFRKRVCSDCANTNTCPLALAKSSTSNIKITLYQISQPPNTRTAPPRLVHPVIPVSWPRSVRAQCATLGTSISCCVIGYPVSSGKQRLPPAEPNSLQ